MWIQILATTATVLLDSLALIITTRQFVFQMALVSVLKIFSVPLANTATSLAIHAHPAAEMMLTVLDNVATLPCAPATTTVNALPTEAEHWAGLVM